MKDQIPAEQTTYSERMGVIAPALGWAPPLRYLLRRARILSLLKKCRPPAALLEIGCGAGALLCDLSRMGYDAKGLETSLKALSMATQLANAVQSTHSVLASPESGWHGKFDIVCAFDVLEHIEDHDAALQEWLQWLSPKGSLIISVPAHRSRWGAGDVWAGHWRRYDHSELRELIAAHGLKIEYFECYGFPLANATEALGNIAYKRMLNKAESQSKGDATASSGVDRRSYLKLNRWINTLSGRAIISLADGLQSLTKGRNWGSGYLVMASRQ
ncbi:class I SAM-dependent methyltransferase [Stenotrophomonas terrae]|uniref:class I SAM-dependent methyltransferase n=1 Tax=Stenotrophomonas terrae TaxID=405446 RepID=UPI003208BCD7